MNRTALVIVGALPVLGATIGVGSLLREEAPAARAAAAATSVARTGRETAKAPVAVPGTSRTIARRSGGETLAASPKGLVPAVSTVPPAPEGGQIAPGVTIALGAAVAGSAGGRPHEPAIAPPAPRAIARIREGLLSPDPRVRLAALRAARDQRAFELETDVALLLEREPAGTTRRVATQFLAQGDVARNAPTLEKLRVDRDPIVQLNASFGLARAGSENDQIFLLLLCEASRGTAPDILAAAATALEDPALRSPVVIARFQAVVDNPRSSPAARARARDVLKAKGA